MIAAIRVSVAALLASGLAVTGLAVMTVAPASAGNEPGHEATFTCFRLGVALHCDVSDVDRVRSIRVYDPQSIFRQVYQTDCGDNSYPHIDFVIFYSSDHLKVTVTDCEHPGFKTVFGVQTRGSVQIRQVSPPL